MSLAFLIAVLLPQTLQADKISVPEPFLGVKETIVKYAQYYAVPENELLSVSWCESQFDQDRLGDLHHGEYLALGEFQIHEDTFYGWEKLYFISTGFHLNYRSSLDRIKLTVWVWKYHPEYKVAWTTYRALKNGGTYTFFSKQLGKTFTVNCSEYKGN